MSTPRATCPECKAELPTRAVRGQAGVRLFPPHHVPHRPTDTLLCPGQCPGSGWLVEDDEHAVVHPVANAMTGDEYAAEVEALVVELLARVLVKAGA